MMIYNKYGRVISRPGEVFNEAEKIMNKELEKFRAKWAAAVKQTEGLTAEARLAKVFELVAPLTDPRPTLEEAKAQMERDRRALWSADRKLATARSVAEAARDIFMDSEAAWREMIGE